MIQDRYLTRLARAYSAQFEAQLNRAPSVEDASSVEAVLTYFHDATDHPMGKAIMLAVMLDKVESGESQFDASTRERATQLFEEIFKDLTDA